jgi:hypothetical protein
MTVAPKKRENGDEYPASAYAYVPDPDDPSTWQLRMWGDPDNQVTVGQIRIALAQYGNAAIPDNDVPKVKRRLLVAWRSVHSQSDELPSALKKAALMAALVELQKTSRPSRACMRTGLPARRAQAR